MTTAVPRSAAAQRRPLVAVAKPSFLSLLRRHHMLSHHHDPRQCRDAAPPRRPLDAHPVTRLTRSGLWARPCKGPTHRRCDEACMSGAASAHAQHAANGACGQTSTSDGGRRRSCCSLLLRAAGLVPMVLVPLHSCFSPPMATWLRVSVRRVSWLLLRLFGGTRGPFDLKSTYYACSCFTCC